MAMSLVRMSSRGESKRWVRRCEATCRPRGIAGLGSADKDISSGTGFGAASRREEWICGWRMFERREWMVVTS